jgi:hypothetical protein
MPDISMCTNITCEKRMKCYRYMATPSYQQSYTCFHHSSDEPCSNFIEISVGDKLDSSVEVRELIRQ